MEIKSAADAATVRARSDWFTGTVWQDPLLEAPDPARVKVVRVTFEPGARTAWHTHPLGQTLHVITGVGRAQTWGGPVRELRPGDTVWIPPGEKHWHGAAPHNGMVHLAIHEHRNGVHVGGLSPSPTSSTRPHRLHKAQTQPRSKIAARPGEP
jgi:quercetin dioxygenase-like cupin family protein